MKCFECGSEKVKPKWIDDETNCFAKAILTLMDARFTKIGKRGVLERASELLEGADE